jgi:hypothetical protein
MRRRLFPDALFHPRHKDFILLLAQIKKYFLCFYEVRHALSGHLAEDGARGMMRVGQLLPQKMHHVCILPHCEVQETPWCGEEALNPVLRPTR